MLDSGTWLHSAFSFVHLGLLLILLIQTAFTQSNLASDSSLQVSHDAVSTLWYITITVLVGRVIASSLWMYVGAKRRSMEASEDAGEKPVQFMALSRWESVVTLVGSALVTFPSSILFGTAIGASSAVYVERGRDKNMLLIIWIILIQGVWSWLELAWSHLYKIKQRVKSERTGINRFLLLVLIILFLGTAFTSTITFYASMRLYTKTTFYSGSTELKNALFLIYIFAILQFAFTILTAVLYALKSFPSIRAYADQSVRFNALTTAVSALAFLFVSMLYGMTLPHVSVVDVLRHEASGMSSIPQSGSIFKPNLVDLAHMTISNFFAFFALIVVIHLAAFSRRPM